MADAYGLPLDAVEAAMAFYRRHQAIIDARIAANAAAPSWPYAGGGASEQGGTTP